MSSPTKNSLSSSCSGSYKNQKAKGVTPTFLVTGATGFTGRHLCSLLAEQSYKFTTDDQVFKNTKIKKTLRNISSLTSVLKFLRPKGIFHCVGTFSNDWKTDFEANALLSKNLLEAVIASSLTCRVLLIGSAAEYGSPFKNKISENAPLAPNSTYGLTKAMQTEIMKYYFRKFKLDIVMARPFNLFGSGCPESLFAGDIQRQVREIVKGKRKKIIVQTLDSSRDFMHISEATKAYLRIMIHGKSGEIYNVGSGVPTLVRNLLKKLIAPYGLTLDDVKIQKTKQLCLKNNGKINYANIQKIKILFKKQKIYK